MNFSLRWRIIVIIAAIGLAIFSLWPTFRYYGLSEAERAQMDPAALEKLQDQALKLGLDLQGGMHLVLEIDDSKVPPEADRKELADRALEVIRNRVDEFGVSEPIVQRTGEKRIIVELPGVADFEHAKSIISKAALLEMKMVRPGGELRRLIDRMDLSIASMAGVAPADTSAAAPVLPRNPLAPDTASTPVIPPRPASVDSVALAQGADSAAAAAEERQSPIELAKFMSQDVRDSQGRPLASRVIYIPRQGRIATNEVGAFRETDVQIVTRYLQLIADSTNVIPRDVELVWDADPYTDQTGNEMRGIYLLTAKPELTGEVLEDARAQPDQSSNISGNFMVEFDLSNQGRRLFSRATGENVGRLMAIVLDGKVKSAPEIMDKIRAGTASITGRFTPQEASDLAIVLRAGALPAPIRIEEQRVVGPSLGKDSIELGKRASIYSFVAILLFMAIYYRVSGLISIIALILNLGFLIALMVQFGATLTLPGIAGLVLTMGMAVDTNVLIYERIREELRNGQSIRNAVSRGFERAFVTIFDSHVTTFVSGIALYWYGSGPVKGFAVTLTIGIVVSLFTAVFVTRAIFDIWTRRGVKSLSI
jgi:protein-export membrane protein SecD